MSRRLLFVSAHLDDVAFSCGPVLAAIAEAEVTIATAFTASVADPTGFALACQLDKGLSAEADYMALRREEDHAWACSLGIGQIVHGPLPEAPHRGYNNARALFEAPHSSDRALAEIRTWLEAILQTLSPDQIFLPAGIGHHVDHVLLRAAGEALVTSADKLFYIDQPYASRNDESANHALAAMERLPWPPQDRDRALRAAFYYSTQIPFQFRDRAGMEQVLRAGWDRFPCWARTK